MSARSDRIKGIFLLFVGSITFVATASISFVGGISVSPGEGISSPPASQEAGTAALGKRSSGGPIVPKPAPLVDPRDDYDVQHYLLDLWLDLDAQEIGGGVTVQATVTEAALDTMLLDLFDNMTVDSVGLGGGPLAFTHQNDQIRIALDRAYLQGEEVSPTVYYHGHPFYSGWASFRFSSHGAQGIPLVFSISWPENSRGWWPCKDVLYDKTTAEVRMTVPVDEHDMVVASVGRLVGIVDNPDTTRTYTWRETYPITTYNISFSTTNFDTLNETYTGIEGETLPIRHFVFPEDRDEAEESFSNLQQMIAAYEPLFGEYPFMGEKYGMAEVQLSGAMEHQTMVSYGKTLIDGLHTYDMTIAHELAHQWFGNMITIGTWPDVWLSEGFATYAEALYEESLTGLDGYLDYMGALDTRDFNDTVYDPDGLLSSTVYNKGAWLLHMLRHIMGDSLWFATLHGYATDTAFMHGNAVTADFIATCEAGYGGDLDWYFDPWLYEVGRPYYYMEWSTAPSGNEFLADVRIDQTQPGDILYTMPLPLVFETASGETTFTVRDSLRTQIFQITLPEDPTGLALDPDNWILKIVQAPLDITTDSLAHGNVGDLYNFALRGEGGLNPYTWTIIQGDLPDSLGLNPGNGLISGVPVEEGSFPFTVELHDAFDPPHADTAAYILVIEPPTGIGSDLVRQGGLPRVYGLSQNYPNPFNPMTTIRVDIPAGDPQRATLAIYDLRGRMVRTLVERSLEAGTYSFSWDGRDDAGQPVPSGTYIYRIERGANRSTKKMLLMK